MNCIGDMAFYGCPIESVVIPSDAVAVGEDAFGLLSGDELVITMYSVNEGVIDAGLGAEATAVYRELENVPESAIS